MIHLTPNLMSLKTIFIVILLIVLCIPHSYGAHLTSKTRQSPLLPPGSHHLSSTPYFYYAPTKLSASPGHQYRRRQSKCNGEENLKQDISIISYTLGGISSIAGLFSLTEFSIVSNNISIISTVVSLILWVPSAVLTYTAASDPLSWLTGNLVNLGSLIITLYGGAGIIFGTLDIIVSSFDEVLGITSLALSHITTFPETFDELKTLCENIFGKQEVDHFLAGYGCTNDFKVNIFRRVIHGVQTLV